MLRSRNAAQRYLNHCRNSGQIAHVVSEAVLSVPLTNFCAKFDFTYFNENRSVLYLKTSIKGEKELQDDKRKSDRTDGGHPDAESS